MNIRFEHPGDTTVNWTVAISKDQARKELNALNRNDATLVIGGVLAEGWAAARKLLGMSSTRVHVRMDHPDCITHTREIKGIGDKMARDVMDYARGQEGEEMDMTTAYYHLNEINKLIMSRLD